MEKSRFKYIIVFYRQPECEAVRNNFHSKYGEYEFSGCHQLSITWFSYFVRQNVLKIKSEISGIDNKVLCIEIVINYRHLLIIMVMHFFKLGICLPVWLKNIAHIFESTNRSKNRKDWKDCLYCIHEIKYIAYNNLWLPTRRACNLY